MKVFILVTWWATSLCGEPRILAVYDQQPRCEFYKAFAEKAAGGETRRKYECRETDVLTK